MFTTTADNHSLSGIRPVFRDPDSTKTFCIHLRSDDGKPIEKAKPCCNSAFLCTGSAVRSIPIA